MGRSSAEGSRRRTRSMSSEASGAKMAEGTRRRTRSMSSEAKMAEGTRRRTRSKAAEAKMASSEERNRILKLESKEDRKILMKVKSEEGKILKLKKEFAAATEAGLVPTVVGLVPVPTVMATETGLVPVPTVMAAQPARKKKKLVKRLVTMTKEQIDFVRAMAKHPCPTRNLTEDQLAKHPKSFQYSYRQDILIRNTRLAYLEALIDQQERFGYAVDESEAEGTDGEI